MEKERMSVRVDPELKAALTRLAQLRKATLNQVANAALSDFVGRESMAVERELGAIIEELRAYRRKDPDLSLSLKRYAAAEAEVAAADDPAEGAVIGDAAEAGPTESRILTLLNAG